MMKISNSKKELAKIISENGGWRGDYNFAAQDCSGSIQLFELKPTIKRVAVVFGHRKLLCNHKPIKNWHQAILSRAEYLHLYPAPDADGWIEWKGGDIDIDDMQLVDYRMACTPDGKHRTSQSMNLVWDKLGEPQDIIAYRLHNLEQQNTEYCESVTWSIPELEANTTIEQLAADYRNKLDNAGRKQDEADKAKVESDAALSELEKAIAAIGFAITPIGAVEQEPELVITDWRDWMVGDFVELALFQGGSAKVGEVGEISKVLCGGEFYVDFPSQSGYSVEHSHIKFISRPAK